MKIREAAQKMNKSEQFLRIGLQKNIFPFGFAVKVNKRYSYYISDKEFNKYIGDKNDS